MGDNQDPQKDINFPPTLPYQQQIQMQQHFQQYQTFPQQIQQPQQQPNTSTNRQSNQPPPPEGKREYGCPCGKTYLSYPALFTHVKQKHDGKVQFSIIFRRQASLLNLKQTKQEEDLKYILK